MPNAIETIEKRRAALKSEIAASRAALSRTSSRLFAAPPAGGTAQNLLLSARRAAAAIDGLLLGYKLLRSFRSLRGLFRSRG